MTTTKTSDSELVNITTLQYLVQLQAKIPNILELRVETFRIRWPEYCTGIDCAIRSGDLRQASDLLHKLRGYSGMLGFTGIQNLCAELETICADCFEKPASVQTFAAAAITNLQHCFEKSWDAACNIIPDLGSLTDRGGS